MKVIELLTKEMSPPEGFKPWYFRAKKPDGSEKEFCRGSFVGGNERQEILKKYPDILNWQVTAEYLPE